MNKIYNHLYDLLLLKKKEKKEEILSISFFILMTYWTYFYKWRLAIVNYGYVL